MPQQSSPVIIPTLVILPSSTEVVAPTGEESRIEAVKNYLRTTER